MTNWNEICRSKSIDHDGSVNSCFLSADKNVITAEVGKGIRCHTNFRHPFNLSWSGKTCDIRRSSKTTS